MTSPKITEGVMGIMKNPQNESENACNRCNEVVRKAFFRCRVSANFNSATCVRVRGAGWLSNWR